MPRVTILRREQSVRFPAPQQAEEVVEVTFVSDLQGVRSAALPLDFYRKATDEELAANPRYRMIPVDKAAEDQEKLEIERALRREAAGPPASFDVP